VRKQGGTVSIHDRVEARDRGPAQISRLTSLALSGGLLLSGRFTVFVPGPGGGVQPSNLLTSMVRSPSRYLSDGTRDFIEIDAWH